MRVHVTWQHDADEALLRADHDIPDEIADEDVASYLEDQHGATVHGWRPQERRADPAGPQRLTCECGSTTFRELGYVTYTCEGKAGVTPEGLTFTGDGQLRHGSDYRARAIVCAECQRSIQTLTAEPFARPDPDQMRVRLSGARQQLAADEGEPSRHDLDYVAEDGTMPNLDAAGSVDAHEAGLEAGLELATGAALRVLCGPSAYIARRDWRLRLLRFAETVVDANGARLITLGRDSMLGVASRLYREGDYDSGQRLLDIACAQQTRVQNTTDANVYIARRYPHGVVIYTSRHGLLITAAGSAPAAAAA